MGNSVAAQGGCETKIRRIAGAEELSPRPPEIIVNLSRFPGTHRPWIMPRQRAIPWRLLPWRESSASFPSKTAPSGFGWLQGYRQGASQGGRHTPHIFPSCSQSTLHYSFHTSLVS